MEVPEHYAVAHLPEHYKEALYKEAIIPAIGGAMARGAAKAVQTVAPKAGLVASKAPKLQAAATKGVGWMQKNKGITGGLAVGAAGGAGLASLRK